MIGMNQLIPVHNSSIITGEPIQTVDARELHAFLEIGRDFTTWISRRIEQYGFAHSVDYVEVLPRSGEAQPCGFAANRKEFFVTLDMAKELSMVERNKKGKEAREYFIACERELMKALEHRAKVAKPTLPDFSNPVAAARAWADAEERRLLVQQQLEEAKPKAEFVDRYVNVGTGSKTFRQVAKLLDAKERDLRQFLQDRRVMYRLNGEWVAYQQHIDADRFETRTSQAENGHVFNQAKFTPKGVAWIAELWSKRNEVAAA